jgi:hypothetical protein
MSIQDPLYKTENIFRIDPFPFSWKLLLILAAFTLLAASLVRSFLNSQKSFSFFILSFHVMAFSFLLYIFITEYDFHSNPIILLISPLFLAICFVTFLTQDITRLFARVMNSNLGLLFLPLAYSIGTNGNLWTASSQAMFFLVLYSWELVQSIDSKRLVHISQIGILAIALPISALSTEFGSSNPYRQEVGIADQRLDSVKNENLGHTFISAETQNSLKKMYFWTKKVGLPTDQPILDLTGQSPLVIFALNAYPVGSPWMVGGYSGSNALAKAVLEEVSCSVLVNSWLLIEPAGPRSLDVDDVISSFGAKLENYSLVARWKSPWGAGGYSEPRLQQMYKPLNIRKGIQSKECNRRFD